MLVADETLTEINHWPLGKVIAASKVVRWRFIDVPSVGWFFYWSNHQPTGGERMSRTPTGRRV